MISEADAIALGLLVFQGLLWTVLHIIFFRNIPQRTIIKGIVILFGTIEILAFAALLILSVTLFRDTLPQKIPVLVDSFVFSSAIYTLVIFIYILGVFGIMESSIRIRLLTEIAKKKTEGIGSAELLKLYNTDMILKKRLDRFVGSGDISYDHGFYRAKTKYSPFLLPAFILRTIWNIYGKRSSK